VFGLVSSVPSQGIG